MCEHKTRFQPTLPGRAQRRSTALQLMAYKQLLDGFPDLLARDFDRMLDSFILQPDAPLSKEVQQHACTLGASVTTLRTLAQQLHPLSQACLAIQALIMQLQSTAADEVDVRSACRSARSACGWTISGRAMAGCWGRTGWHLTDCSSISRLTTIWE